MHIIKGQVSRVCEIMTYAAHLAGVRWITEDRVEKDQTDLDL